MIKNAERRRTVSDLSDDLDELDSGRIVDGEPSEDVRIANQDFSENTLRQIVIRRSFVEAV